MVPVAGRVRDREPGAGDLAHIDLDPGRLVAPQVGWAGGAEREPGRKGEGCAQRGPGRIVMETRIEPRAGPHGESLLGFSWSRG